MKILLIVLFLFICFPLYAQDNFGHNRWEALKEKVQNKKMPLIPVENQVDTQKVYSPVEREADVVPQYHRSHSNGYVTWEAYLVELSKDRDAISDLKVAIQKLSNDAADVNEGVVKQVDSQQKSFDRFMSWLNTIILSLTGLVTAVGGLAFLFRKQVKKTISDYTTDYEKVAEHIKRNEK
jgi:hypothetical protein